MEDFFLGLNYVLVKRFPVYSSHSDFKKTVVYTSSLSVFGWMCSFRCAPPLTDPLLWIALCSPRSIYQVSVFLGEKQAERKKKEGEEQYRSGAVSLTFQTAGIIMDSSDVPSLVLPLLHPFVSAPGGCVFVCIMSACVFICVLELQIKPKLNCFDCSL